MNHKTKFLIDKPVAHRGLHNKMTIPENSMEAFEESINKGYSIELDVHMLEDGVIIVYHDDNLLRLTGVDANIREKRWSSIKKLQLYGTDQYIPKFEDVLDLVAGKVPILIEIKSSQKVGPLESALNNLLKNYSGETAIQSFNPRSLEWFKVNSKQVIRGQISCDFRDDVMPLHKKTVLKRMLLNKLSEPHFISYDHRCLPNQWVLKEVQKRDIPVLAWTINTFDQKINALKYSDNVIFENILP